MEKVEKLAVFDLDGTIWKINSHFDIIRKYYGYGNIWHWIVRLYGRISMGRQMEYLFKIYNFIPSNYIDNYCPDFRESAISLIKGCANEGYQIIIVSNAPEKIVRNAANRLSIPYFRSEVGKKYEDVYARYSFGKLLVCTDNKMDIDLLQHADVKYIYITKSTKRFFKNKFKNAIFMEE